MAMKDEGNSANTVPCSLTLTENKLYLCHDEQDNALIRQLESVKLEYITRVHLDPQCQYYCTLLGETYILKFEFNFFIYCFFFFFVLSLLNMAIKVQNLGLSIFYLLKKQFNLLKIYKKPYLKSIRLYILLYDDLLIMFLL